MTGRTGEQAQSFARPRVIVAAACAVAFLLEGAYAQQPGQTGTSLSIDLPAALRRARDFSQQYLAAATAAQSAHEDRLQARAAQYPTVNALNQYIYTQGNGTPSGVFVANDGVHVYNEQATVHAELFSFARRAEVKRAAAAEAGALAQQEIASRGLSATVVQYYYALVTAQRHLENARRSVEETERFLDITQKQERGGEAAHADVVKAQLQVHQRRRDLLDGEAATQRARLALGVIILPDFAQPYTIVDDLRPDLPLAPFDEFHQQAVSNSPETRAAEAGLRQAEASVSAAKAAYLPFLAIDYFYGIDANVFSNRGPGDRQNLGSVVQGTVNVPVWNWGITRSKVRQAELQVHQAQFGVTYAQRGLEAALRTAYLEAQTARAQIEGLRNSLDLSEESLRLTVLRYQAGEATALEVTDAQSTLAQARNAHDDGLARYRLAVAGLQTLTGRF